VERNALGRIWSITESFLAFELAVQVISQIAQISPLNLKRNCLRTRTAGLDLVGEGIPGVSYSIFFVTLRLHPSFHHLVNLSIGFELLPGCIYVDLRRGQVRTLLHQNYIMWGFVGGLGVTGTDGLGLACSFKWIYNHLYFNYQR